MRYDMDSKILSFIPFLEKMESYRKQQTQIVHCHGCFDVVHPGHIQHLVFASRLADVLVVTLTADMFVNKGKDRPFFADDLRAMQIAALGCVDWVYVNPTPTAEYLIEIIRPRFYVKGREYRERMTDSLRREESLVSHFGGELAFSPCKIGSSRWCRIQETIETA